MGTVLAAVVSGILAATGMVAGAPDAKADQVAPVADTAPGYAVENFAYPQADKILAEKNIVLKRGDGHITLADCATGTGFFEVWARAKDKICFQTTGNTGWLTLEIPSVYVIKSNEYGGQVDMTLGTEEKSFDIGKDTWTPVGESADPGQEYMLVEIRTSK